MFWCRLFLGQVYVIFIAFLRRNTHLKVYVFLKLTHEMKVGMVISVQMISLLKIFEQGNACHTNPYFLIKWNKFYYLSQTLFPYFLYPIVSASHVMLQLWLFGLNILIIFINSIIMFDHKAYITFNIF